MNCAHYKAREITDSLIQVEYPNMLTMIYKHLQTAFRQLQLRAGFSFQRIAAFAAGLAICCEAVLLMQKGPAELTDLPRYDRVCKVNLDARFGDLDGLLSKTPAAAAAVIVPRLPEIEMATRAYCPEGIEIRRKAPVETPALEKMPQVLAVDPNFVDMFHFRIVAGSAYNCLQNPESVVLSESIATQFFGNPQDAIGQSLLIGKIHGKITLVVKDQLQDAPIQFDVLCPVSNFDVVERNEWNWTWLKVETWVRLREQPVPEIISVLEAKFPEIMHEEASESFDRIGANYNEMLEHGGRWNLRLQPLSAPIVPEIAANTSMSSTSRRFTFGVLGFHLKNLL